MSEPFKLDDDVRDKVLTRHRWDELSADEAHELTEHLLAALDALRAELADARSGALMKRAVVVCDDLYKLSLERDALAAERDKLREELWLSHGHVTALYGDDGEMQCPVCMVDFKRQPVDEIIAGMRRATLAASKEAPKPIGQAEAVAMMQRNYPRSNLHNAYEVIEGLSGQRVFNVVAHNPYVHGHGTDYLAAIFNAAVNYPIHAAASKEGKDA